MEWISVKDKLPKVGEHVLTWVEREGDSPYHYIWSIYGDKSWGDDNFAIEPDEKVTHWMPLPEPPK